MSLKLFSYIAKGKINQIYAIQIKQYSNAFSAR